MAELEERIHVLEQRLAAVEAVQEITRLKARYAELIDRLIDLALERHARRKSLRVTYDLPPEPPESE